MTNTQGRHGLLSTQTVLPLEQSQMEVLASSSCTHPENEKHIMQQPEHTVAITEQRLKLS
ncbi:hypothetical protein DPMN_008358 [Dreissena polymorpha]|uniref:Uncharacterized protein n=1 Tax=Dreissena polymorpha TaxID=45954 RepID=A0A9D4MY81_DREPO|nr:hypothetical protein DPMN_008358 [Dreissena polymorpha]